MKLCWWNIAALKDKLQEPSILKFILDFDIVWILEATKYFNVQVPGLSVCRNVSRSGRNRGVVMLGQDALVHSVKQVDVDAEDQICHGGFVMHSRTEVRRRIYTSR